MGQSVAVISESFTVYIIDDDASVRSSLSRLMRSADLQSKAFARPEEFLEIAESATKGCVLLDITMPHITGTEMQARLRDMRFKLPVIVVSASESDDARKSAFALGAQFFLRKPVDDQALIDAINWVTETTASSRLH